jgi:Sulfotransferase domain
MEEILKQTAETLQADRERSRLIERALRLNVRVLRRGIHISNWLAAWLSFTARPDDIYIVTYPRSGTTWLQMILYQLTTEGEMDFSHISEVIPFLERAVGLGRDLNLLRSPRIFKVHLPYRFMQLWPGKYIYVARNGKDVLMSYFHFYTSHFNFRGTFAQFFELFMRGKVQGGSWFVHVKEWERHARDSNVLFLHYEELVRDFSTYLARIAEFCGFQIPAGRRASLVERCSFAFMKQHEAKFDHVNELLWEMGLSQGLFLRRGRVGSWRGHFTDEQEEQFDKTAKYYFG